jgi:hypothetical protein
MIKETLNHYRFTDVLMSDEYASWTHGATKALFDYYEQLSEDIDDDIELDRVAIRCEWTEYDTCVEALRDHDEIQYQLYVNELDEDKEEQAREWLEERTTVLDVENVDTSANEYRTIKSILVREF